MAGVLAVMGGCADEGAGPAVTDELAGPDMPPASLFGTNRESPNAMIRPSPIRKRRKRLTGTAITPSAGGLAARPAGGRRGYALLKRARAPRSMAAAISRSIFRRWRIISSIRVSSSVTSWSAAATSQAST